VDGLIDDGRSAPRCRQKRRVFPLQWPTGRSDPRCGTHYAIYRPTPQGAPDRDDDPANPVYRAVGRNLQRSHCIDFAYAAIA
jgi:hypothetical protein